MSASSLIVSMTMLSLNRQRRRNGIGESVTASAGKNAESRAFAQNVKNDLQEVDE